MRSTANIEELLLKLKEDYTLVIVTHNIFQARRIADDMIFMNQGKVVETGPAAQIFLSAVLRQIVHNRFITEQIYSRTDS